MTESILQSTKKALNLDADYTEFDPEIIMFINTVFSTLNQIGVGPELGFSITGSNEVWSTFLGTDARLNNVQTYMALKVRMLFDPPTTGPLIAAMEKAIEELEVRMSILRESSHYTNPNPVPENVLEELQFDEIVFDGGTL